MTLPDFSKARVAVVGDAMTDRWVRGRIDRISPEGPWPVFVEETVEETDGGAANVAANVRALGGRTVLGAKIKYYWPQKLRYMVGRHQVGPRFDCEDVEPIDAERQREILDLVDDFAPNAIVISDYAKGVCTPRLCRDLIGWAKIRNVRVVVDPKGDDWSKYAGADVVTPNEAEWTTTGPYIPDIPWVVETRGAKGMKLWPLSLTPIEIPAAAHEVYDVTGAGDTVVAVLAAALAVGTDLEAAARWANAAAGVVVQKRGTATCSREELEAAL